MILIFVQHIFILRCELLNFLKGSFTKQYLKIWDLFELSYLIAITDLKYEFIKIRLD